MNLVKMEMCEDCMEFDPEVLDLYADNKVYNRTVQCKDYTKCRRALYFDRQKIHDDIIRSMKENKDAFGDAPIPMWRIVVDIEDATGIYDTEEDDIKEICDSVKDMYCAAHGFGTDKEDA